MKVCAWSWKMPRQVPPLSMMLDDLGNPPAQILARSLGVSERTARRWIRADSAPLPVLLSVFWLTSWGRSQIHIEAENAARLHAGLHECLRHENSALHARIDRLQKIGDFGCANRPEFREPDLKVWR